MEITTKDLGKIVELPIKPEWGPGIISKVDFRFAHIVFRDLEEKVPKKYYLTENPLKWAANQEEPSLVKKARGANRKVKPKAIVYPAS